MKQNKLQIFYCITFALWFIPWQFKKTLPAIFGDHYVQWSLVAIVSLLIPIGSLWSLYWIHKEKKGGYSLLLAFSFILSFTLFSHAVVQPLLMRSKNILLSMYSKDAETISTLTNQIHESKPQEDREKNLARARGLYRFYGIKPYLPTKNGGFEIYSSTEKDEKNRKEAQQTKKFAIKTENMINWQLKQTVFLFSVYLGNYIFIMALGLGVYCYKRKKISSETFSEKKGSQLADLATKIPNKT